MTLKFSKSKQLRERVFEDVGTYEKIKTPKKENVSALKKKLMILVKQFVRERDDYTCQYCHKKVEGSNCHVSHVIPVSHGNRLAFEAVNMKILCYHHHINWWHKNPLESAEWFKRTFPTRWAYLEEHKNERVHWKAEDYKNMIKHYGTH
jgi:5-methylcytosine-specific restriction endonuclease McrA